MSETDKTGWFVGVIVALALLAVGYLVTAARMPPSSGPSATFIVYTDEGTGCQYIARTGYDIEPRMGSDGKQVCVQAEEPSK